MSGDRRALLMMISSLYGCFVLAVSDSENKGRIIPDATIVEAGLGDAAALSCYVLGSVSDFGWRKIEGNAESEETLTKLTNTCRFNETHFRMDLHFIKVFKKDVGTYQCWAKGYKNSLISGYILLTVVHYAILRDATVNALNSNQFCVRWDFQNTLIFNHVIKIRIQSLENGSCEWHDVHHFSPINARGIHVATAYKRNTAYWFKVTAKTEFNGTIKLFSRWLRTSEKDSVYVPLFWVRETSVDSITIEWSKPPLEIENCFNNYRVTAYDAANHDKLDEYFIDFRDTQYKMEHLEPRASYRFQLEQCMDFFCGHVLYNSRWLENIVPKDRDPKFTPDVSAIEEGINSITVTWNAPPADLQDRIYYYKLALSTEYVNNKTLYVNKTENSHTFQNLLSNTTYRFKVAACAEYKTQCGNWSVEQEAFTRISDSRSGVQEKIWLIASAIVTISVIITLTMLAWNIRRKALKRKLMKARLEYFNFEAPISLDPELAVSDQAELLPYHKKWEFPRHLLTLGEVLGSGAFGVVRMGQARTICSREVVTTVAVKTVRPTASLNCMKALLHELKILVYLGQHLNIVNLLGACTKNIDYGELLVIVEYCRYGNLHDYLIRHRVNFIDQLNKVSSVSKSDGKVCSLTGRENAIDVADYRANIEMHSDGVLTTIKYTNNTASKTPDAEVDDHFTTDSSGKLNAPLKYPGDQTDFNSRPTCTYDLVCWAWQISCGMQYLSAKRILHGDLATRNILLTDCNVVKICDFGLSKSLHEEENHKNTENGPLPVKWMAIESLRDRVFSTKSDVWSFGVVLWELFFLARTPYPQIRPEDMCRRLTEGYRMEKPPYAPRSIYKMMLRCWKVEPSERPSFEKLTYDISDLIEDQLKTYYLELGNPYTMMYADIWKRERETAVSSEESVTIGAE